MKKVIWVFIVVVMIFTHGARAAATVSKPMYGGVSVPKTLVLIGGGMLFLGNAGRKYNHS
jgi:hypothetical protein